MIPEFKNCLKKLVPNSYPLNKHIYLKGMVGILTIRRNNNGPRILPLAEKEIAILREKLRGKRKFILINIEARFIGYQNHNEERAVEILESVPKNFRDRQWYAVKMQLLENTVEKYERAKRSLLVNEYKKELKNLKDIVEQKYGDKALNETDLLPDK